MVRIAISWIRLLLALVPVVLLFKINHYEIAVL